MYFLANTLIFLYNASHGRQIRSLQNHLRDTRRNPARRQSDTAGRAGACHLRDAQAGGTGQRWAGNLSAGGKRNAQRSRPGSGQPACAEGGHLPDLGAVFL